MSIARLKASHIISRCTSSTLFSRVQLPLIHECSTSPWFSAKNQITWKALGVIAPAGIRRFSTYDDDEEEQPRQGDIQKAFVQVGGNATAIRVRVRANADRPGLVRVNDQGEIVVELPVSSATDDKANNKLREYLSETLQRSIGDIQLENEKSDRKVVKVQLHSGEDDTKIADLLAAEFARLPRAL